MVCIYEEMIDTQREDLKGNPDRKRMAKENLSEAIDFFGHNGDNFMMQIVRKLINLIEND
jgi:hypothetical protein